MSQFLFITLFPDNRESDNHEVFMQCRPLEMPQRCPRRQRGSRIHQSVTNHLLPDLDGNAHLGRRRIALLCVCGHGCQMALARF